jgi:hypothetical protein
MGEYQTDNTARPRFDIFPYSPHSQSVCYYYYLLTTTLYFLRAVNEIVISVCIRKPNYHNILRALN